MYYKMFLTNKKIYLDSDDIPHRGPLGAQVWGTGTVQSLDCSHQDSASIPKTHKNKN
jgi:hypothetical protein